MEVFSLSSLLLHIKTKPQPLNLKIYLKVFLYSKITMLGHHPCVGVHGMRGGWMLRAIDAVYG